MDQNLIIHIEVYKTIHDSLENHKIMNCRGLNYKLHKLWMGSVYVRKHP